MARFYGEVDGGRGPVHRLGHATSGIRVEARGWDFGVEVTGEADVADGDAFEVQINGGSNKSGCTTPVLLLRRKGTGDVEFRLHGVIAQRLREALKRLAENVPAGRQMLEEMLA